MKKSIFKNIIQKSCFLSCIFAVILYAAMGCEDYPVDEDGLLITERSECYVSSFELLGVDYQTVRTKAAVIDTLECTIDVEVFFGTDLKNLYPQFTLVTDAKLEPKITGLTDFSDLAHPRQYTVISGNRQVRKAYTVNLTVQKP
ncbi:MAG: hypothetical protein LBQ73_11180 [Tannerellaceae bacterium]|jgi:hypothetical protein|nr:hypothetical protein [Tannerellaceae bacterium]